jgi:hypothetical protein
MAGKGPLPKPRRGRTRDEKPSTELQGRAAVPPDMPDGPWLHQTASWWSTWASSEQAEHFTATSWQRLAMLMPLVDAYWREPSKELLAEIRLNESKLGATPEDLLRLRWKIAKPRPGPTKDYYAHLEEDE